VVCFAFFYYLQLYNWFADDNILPLSVTPTWKCRPFRSLKSVTLLGIIEMVIKFNLVKYK